MPPRLKREVTNSFEDFEGWLLASPLISCATLFKSLNFSKLKFSRANKDTPPLRPRALLAQCARASMEDTQGST